MTWVNRLERGRVRAAVLRRSFSHLIDLARVVRDVAVDHDVGLPGLVGARQGPAQLRGASRHQGHGSLT
jgi:hypothetical protein